MNTIAFTILGMFGLSEVILILILPIIFILLIGAWMLRINEVIRLQKEILEELKKRNVN